jgi:hypothetical protein
MWKSHRPAFGLIAGPYYDGPDAGGEFDAQPDYDIELDNGDGGTDDPAYPAHSGAQPPRAPVQDPRRDSPAPGQDQRAPTTFSQEQYNQVITGYRDRERQLQGATAQIQLLQRQVAALTGAQPPSQTTGQQPQLSEADQKAITAVYRLFPGLKPLLEKSQELLTLPQAVQGFKTDAEARWTDLGTRMWQAFDQTVSQAFPGGKLHPFAQQSIDSAFVAWLEADKNAAARYRLGDMTLPTEFMAMYRNGVIVPAQRAAGTQPPQRGVPGRAGMQPRVPRGGPSASPAGQRPAQPDPKDAGAVHDAAADAYFAGQR